MAQFNIAGNVTSKVRKVNDNYVIPMADNSSKDHTTFMDVFTSSKEIAEAICVGMSISVTGDISTYKKDNKTEVSFWARRIQFLTTKDECEARAKRRAIRKAKENSQTDAETKEALYQAYLAKKKAKEAKVETEDERSRREFDEIMANM